MKGKTINEHWESYRDKVIPKDASPSQISESCLVFWAASAAMYNMIMDAVGADSEAECSKALAAIDLELQTHKTAIVTLVDEVELKRSKVH